MKKSCYLSAIFDQNAAIPAFWTIWNGKAADFFTAPFYLCPCRLYGPAGFGGEATYGSPQQILVPVIVTQMKGGKLVEVSRIEPAELVKHASK